MKICTVAILIAFLVNGCEPSDSTILNYKTAAEIEKAFGPPMYKNTLYPPKFSKMDQLDGCLNQGYVFNSYLMNTSGGMKFLVTVTDPKTGKIVRSIILAS